MIGHKGFKFQYGGDLNKGVLSCTGTRSVGLKEYTWYTFESVDLGDLT